MLYRMIYFSSHKFAFSNPRFSPFYENFLQLLEKYALKLKIKYTMLISSKSPIWWCAHICIFLKKPFHPLHALHLPIQNILLAVNPFHSFFCKKLVGRENIEQKSIWFPCWSFLVSKVWCYTRRKKGWTVATLTWAYHIKRLNRRSCILRKMRIIITNYRRKQAAMLYFSLP